MPRSDRLGITIGLVWLGLILSIMLPLPSREIHLFVLRSELTLSISGAAQLAVLMGLFVCIGVDATIRSYSLDPKPQPSFYMSFWPLPVFLTLLGLLSIRRIEWWGYQMGLIILIGLALSAIVSLQYRSLKPEKAQAASWMLMILAYGAELALLIILYGLRWRSVLSATSILTVSALLTLDLLRDRGQQMGRAWFYALLVGVLMSQFTWALNYLSIGSFVGGTFLFLVFYVLTGLIRQGLGPGLTPRVLIEYGLLGAAGLVLLGQAAF